MRAPHTIAPSTRVIHLVHPTRKSTNLIYVDFAWQIISNQLGPTKTDVIARDLKNWKPTTPSCNWRHSMGETNHILGQQRYAMDSNMQSTGKRLVVLECWHQYIKPSYCLALGGNVTCIHSRCHCTMLLPSVTCWTNKAYYDSYKYQHLDPLENQSSSPVFMPVTAYQKSLR